MGAIGPPEERRPQPGRPQWGVLALVGLTGFAMLRAGLSEDADGPPQPGTSSSAFAPADSRPDAPAPLPRSAVSRVAIPALKVSAPAIPLGLDKDGWIEAPPTEDPRLTGWYEDAPTPGEKGTAVVVGHVDNFGGPAVFYGLGALKKGNTVEVTRKDHRTAVFTVYGIEVYDQKHFPSEKVYGSTGRPEIRVLTCGGGYSASAGYAGNVVVFARMTAVH